MSWLKKGLGKLGEKAAAVTSGSNAGEDGAGGGGYKFGDITKAVLKQGSAAAAVVVSKSANVVKEVKEVGVTRTLGAALLSGEYALVGMDYDLHRIFEAVEKEKGDLAAIESLHRRGVALNKVDKTTGNSLSHAAADLNRVEILSFVLSVNMYVGAERGVDQCTPAMLAVIKGHVQVLRALHEAKVLLLGGTTDGGDRNDDPLDSEDEEAKLKWSRLAAFHGQEEVLRFLHESNLLSFTRDKTTRLHCLHDAARGGKIHCLNFLWPIFSAYAAGNTNALISGASGQCEDKIDLTSEHLCLQRILAMHGGAITVQSRFPFLTEHQQKHWHSPRSKLLVFVSSTFTDTKRQRNILLERIAPQLRHEASKHSVDVTFVDMRWGVRDENTCDHMTWDSCLVELERCRTESAGLFFLSLQGDKYGYRPLPRTLPQALLKARVLSDTAAASETVKEAARKWYILDQNAVPPQYVLKTLESTDEKAYWDIFEPLKEPLLGASFEVDDFSDGRSGNGDRNNNMNMNMNMNININMGDDSTDGLLVGRSVTEWETKNAMRTQGNLPRCRWLHTHFAGGVSAAQDPKWLLNDARDTATMDKLLALKAWMKEHFQRIRIHDDNNDISSCSSSSSSKSSSSSGSGSGKVDRNDTRERVAEFLSVTVDSYNAEDVAWNAYLEQWEAYASRVLFAELGQVLADRKQWLANGTGVGMCGAELEEILHHCTLSTEKVAAFEGRRELLDQALQVVYEPNKVAPPQPEKSRGEKRREERKKKKEEQKQQQQEQQQQQQPYINVGDIEASLSGDDDDGSDEEEEENGASNAPATTVNADRVSSPSSFSSPNGSDVGFNGIALAVVGESGTGKASLLAQLAEDIYRKDGGNRPVIVRYCGTSRGSGTGAALMRSICVQIHYLYGLEKSLVVGQGSEEQSPTSAPTKNKNNNKNNNNSVHMSGSSSSIPEEYFQLRKHFHMLLSKYPVVLLIDSLDQLSDNDFERSALSFLTGLAPHANTRIIVSTLPDTNNNNSTVATGCGASTGAYAGAAGAAGAMYGCESCLKSAVHCHKLTVHPFSLLATTTTTSTTRAIALNPAATIRADADAVPVACEAEEMFSRLLQKMKRTVSTEQLTLFQRSVQVEPSALYVSLAVSVAQHWHSSKTDMVLPAGVTALVQHIFDTTERDFGKVLTRAAVGFITLSVKGVSDNEMVDLLSLDESPQGVLNNTYQYDTPGVRRLPVHVWMRLRSALQHLLVEGAAGCLKWRHDAVHAAALVRYTTLEQRAIHRCMAQYFGDLLDPAVCAAKLVSRQPLALNGVSVWLDSSVVNHRRCTEAFEHMLRAGGGGDKGGGGGGSGKFVADGDGDGDMLAEAAAEMCSFEFVCASARIGNGFVLSDALIVLHDALAMLSSNSSSSSSSTDSAASTSAGAIAAAAAAALPVHWRDRVDVLRVMTLRVRDYMRWLLHDMTTIVRSPAMQIPATLTATQPVVSVARREMLEYLQCTADKSDADYYNISSSSDSGVSNNNNINNNGNITTPFLSSVWTRGRSLYAPQDFGALMATLRGHKASVRCVDCSTDGKFYASGSQDGTLLLWRADTGAVLLQMQAAHQRAVWAVAVSQDSSRVVSVSSDDTMAVWDASTGALCWRTKLQEPQTVSLHAKTINVQLRLIAGLVSGLMPDVYLGLLCVSYSPCGGCIAVGAYDGTVRIHNAATGEQQHRLLGNHEGGVTAVQFVQNCSTALVSVGADGRVVMWSLPPAVDVDADSGSAVIRSAVVRHHSRCLLTCLAAFCEGAKIVYGDGHRTLRVVDIQSQKDLFHLNGHSSHILSVTVSNDDTTIASTSSDQTIRLWSATDGAALRILEDRGYVILASISASTSVRFLPVGTSAAGIARTTKPTDMLITSSMSCTLKKWDLRAGTTNEAGEDMSGAAFVFITAAAFTADSKNIVTAYCENSIHVWNVESTNNFRKALSLPAEHTGWIGSLSCSQQAGGEAVMASASQDSTIRIWNIHSEIVDAIAAVDSQQQPPQRLLLTLSGQHEGGVLSVSFSGDGSKLISGGEDTKVVIWDVSIARAGAGAVLFVLLGQHSDVVQCVQFDASGRFAASASADSTVCLWNVVSGKALGKLTGHVGSVTGVAFAPASNDVVAVGTTPTSPTDITMRLATSGKDSTIGLWRVIISGGGAAETMELISSDLIKSIKPRLMIPTAVLSVSYTPCGKQILAACADCKVRIWNTTSGRKLRTIKVSQTSGHSEEKIHAVLAPNGAAVLAVTLKSVMSVWDPATGAVAGSIRTGSETALTGISYTADNKRLVSCSAAGAFKVWNTVEDALEGQYVCMNQAVLMGLSCSPDNRHVAFACTDHTVQLYCFLLPQSGDSKASTAPAVVAAAAAAAAAGAKPAKPAKPVKPTKPGKPAAIELRHVLRGHTSSVMCVAFSPTGQRVASGSLDSSVKVWEVNTGALLHSMCPSTLSVLSEISVSNTLTYLAYNASAEHRMARTYVTSISFCGDDEHLVAGYSSAGSVRLWDLTTHSGKKGPTDRLFKATLTAHSMVRGVVTSSDGRLVLAVQDCIGAFDKGFLPEKQDKAILRIYDSSTGLEVVRSERFSGSGIDSGKGKDKGNTAADDKAKAVLHLECNRPSSFALSPNGRALAVGHVTGSIEIWELPDGGATGQRRLCNTLRGHSSVVTSLTFRGDGRKIASASADSTVREWDVSVALPSGPMSLGKK